MLDLILYQVQNPSPSKILFYIYRIRVPLNSFALVPIDIKVSISGNGFKWMSSLSMRWKASELDCN